MNSSKRAVPGIVVFEEAGTPRLAGMRGPEGAQYVSSSGREPTVNEHKESDPAGVEQIIKP
jgi:hypothetical protein